MNRLMLCSGVHKREGWVTLDANHTFKPDILATIPPLPPEVTNRKWDEIEWIHGIGSLYLWDARQVLKELRDSLTPEGVLILEQPDARKCADRIKATGSVKWMFGDPDLKEPMHMNKWAYTPESLLGELARAGFTRARLKSAVYHVPERDFRVEARP